jgi:hypothetical protein
VAPCRARCIRGSRRIAPFDSGDADAGESRVVTAALRIVLQYPHAALCIALQYPQRAACKRCCLGLLTVASERMSPCCWITDASSDVNPAEEFASWRAMHRALDVRALDVHRRCCCSHGATRDVTPLVHRQPADGCSSRADRRHATADTRG